MGELKEMSDFHAFPSGFWGFFIAIAANVVETISQGTAGPVPINGLSHLRAFNGII